MRRRASQGRVESCSSGGARVDLGILDRTDRVSAWDCTDALGRRASGGGPRRCCPPELVGFAHRPAYRAHHPAHAHCHSAPRRPFSVTSDWSGISGTSPERRAPNWPRRSACTRPERALLHSGCHGRTRICPIRHTRCTAWLRRMPPRRCSHSSAWRRRPARLLVGSAFPALMPADDMRWRLLPAPETGRTCSGRRRPGCRAVPVPAVATSREVGLPMPILAPEHSILLQVTAL